MIFSSLLFMYIFMPLLFIAYFITKNNSMRRAVLTMFSLVFYAWEEPLYVFLMVLMVGFNYIFGRLIASYKTDGMRKIWLVVAVVLNLSVLCFYKYTGFFADTLNNIFSLNVSVPRLTMPIGISFFTFQAMSYVVDVYRGDAEVQESFSSLLLYVSFFPQLIAGPIVRYKDIEDQLPDRRVKIYDINDGIFRFSIGLTKKIIIADNCALAVNSLYNMSGDITLAARWFGAVFFALQIYYDFSGYSDMAIGLGHMFGFKFNENFRYPYAASNATEFWRRWHISLGTFFRDYVYIPLGGNRRWHIRNILIVWFLTGLWHGASWNFVIWGMFYGLLLIFEKKFFIAFLKRLPKALSAVISRIYFIFITVFGFAIFYFSADTLKSLGYMFGIGVSSLTDIFTSSIIMENIVLLAVGIIFAYPVVPAVAGYFKRRFSIPYDTRRYIMCAISLLLLAAATVRMVGDTYSPFLYWNF